MRRPLDPCISSSTSLPPPLIPLPKAPTGLGAEEETGTEAPILTQELESTLGEKELGEPEMAVEALSNMEISPVEEKEETEVKFSTDQPTTGPFFRFSYCTFVSGQSRLLCCCCNQLHQTVRNTSCNHYFSNSLLIN